MKKCKLPKRSDEVEIRPEDLECLEIVNENPIEDVIVIDGSFSTVPVKEKFPSSEITFFQFGALRFGLSDLTTMSEQEFVGPEDISKLKEEFGRLKFVIPTKNIILDDETSILESVRKSIFDFFCSEIDFKFFDIPETEKFIDGFKWLIYEEYKDSCNSYYTLGSCPHCSMPNVPLKREEMIDYTFKCPNPKCGKTIYLTDILRFHELINEDFGASGIIKFLLRTLEQFLLVLIIKIILKNDPNFLSKTLFIQDGPLAFFGQTAKIFASMRSLVNFLFNNYDLNLIGLEKTGPFVEHAEELSSSSKLQSQDILILNTKYIYSNIKYGDPHTTEPFGRSTYYGNKIIFKSNHNIYVATLPTEENLLSPKKDDFKNIDLILTNIELLKCELYEDAIIPIVLANRLVSISDYPSSAILKKHARKELGE